MNGNMNAEHSWGNIQSGDPYKLKQASQLLTLLVETERTIHLNPDIASTYLNQAIDLLSVDTQSDSERDRNRGGLVRWQISCIDKYIKEHLDQCIRTSELASSLSLSVSHFSHAFKKTTGKTPMMYVAAARVKAARQHMLSSAKSLSEIALNHGFCDQSHFCRIFRRETGLSPQAWRKLYVKTPLL
jgi:AraC-like DNA-binding protein